MMLESLREILSDKNFASPYCKNHSSNYVLSFQPVEKAMFAYKLLAELDTNLCSPSKEYAVSAQYLFEWMDIPSIIVSGSLKIHPEKKHFWNIVTIDGYDFHFDAYFANPKHLKMLNHIKDMESLIVGNSVCDFLCASTSRVSQTHVFGEDFPSVDCPHSLSHELVRKLASMRVSVRRDSYIIQQLGKVMTSGLMPPEPKSPLCIDYSAASTPITLSFE